VVGDIDHPAVIYDLKTGNAQMSPQQLKNYKANLPKGTVIKVLRPKTGQ